MTRFVYVLVFYLCIYVLYSCIELGICVHVIYAYALCVQMYVVAHVHTNGM